MYLADFLALQGGNVDMQSPLFYAKNFTTFHLLQFDDCLGVPSRLFQSGVRGKLMKGIKCVTSNVV